MPITIRIIRIAPLVILCIVPTLAGCGGGEAVTAKSLGEAERLWKRARIRDYDLEWTSSGLSTGHYRVAVREGQVRSIELVQPDGQSVAAHPADPTYYGVEGLFRIVKDELAQ